MVGHLLNSCFSIFCTYRFGRHTRNIIGKSGHREGENILMKITNMISYEIPVCLYLIYGLFMFIWLILGHAWIHAEPSNSMCNSDHKVAYNLRTADLVASIFMWIFVFGGFLLAIFTATTYSCEEGSCILWDVCRFIGLFLTCGLLDIGKVTKKGPVMIQSAPDRYAQNKARYTPIRWGWIPKAKEILLELGFGARNTSKAETTPNTSSLVDIKVFKKVNDGLGDTSVHISQNDTTVNFQNNPASQFFEERHVNLPSQIQYEERNVAKSSRSQRNRSSSFGRPETPTGGIQAPQVNIPKIKSFNQVSFKIVI